MNHVLFLLPNKEIWHKICKISIFYKLLNKILIFYREVKCLMVSDKHCFLMKIQLCKIPINGDV